MDVSVMVVLSVLYFRDYNFYKEMYHYSSFANRNACGEGSGGNGGGRRCSRNACTERRG